MWQERDRNEVQVVREKKKKKKKKKKKNRIELLQEES